MQTKSDLYGAVLDDIKLSIHDLEKKLHQSEVELQNMYDTYERLCRGYSIMKKSVVTSSECVDHIYQ